ncbi:MAG: hypothetical protein K6T83_09635 [Alicyclobacillus sp.]|nr:hypothetical protein [Alicyclobacillus sp.]
MQLAFVASTREFANARKMQTFLEKEGVPIVIRARRDHGGHWLFTFSGFQEKVRGIRERSA